MNINLTDFTGQEISGKYLVLVNKEYTIPEDWSDTFDPVVFKDHDMKTFILDKAAADAFAKLQAFLSNKGIYVDVCSAYRSIEYQRQLFESAEKDIGVSNKQMKIAEPLHSEHHTGLAIDLSVYDGSEWIDDEDSQFEKEILESIQDCFHLFGFILRYPAGKEKKTAIAYEPWHIRYVGKKAAAVIYNNGDVLCMEDFI